MDSSAYSKLVVSGGIILGLGMVWYAQLDSHKPNSIATEHRLKNKINASFNNFQNSTQQQLDNLIEKQNSLSNEVSELRELVHAYVENKDTVNQQTSSEVSNSEPEQEIVSEEEFTARLELAEQEQQNEIVSRLELEESDPDWSIWAETEIMTAFESSETVDATLYTTKCHTSFCRVEGTFGNAETRDNTITNLMTHIPWEAQAFFYEDESGGNSSALYIMREGYSESQPIL